MNWIPSTNMEPEGYAPLWLHDATYGVIPGITYVEKIRNLKKRRWIAINGCTLDNVTHWMQIDKPNPPIEPVVYLKTEAQDPGGG